MTKREIASLACKILAVYALLHIPQYLQGVYFALSSIIQGEPIFGDTSGVLLNFSIFLIPTLLYLAVGILLWRRSDALASRMVSDDQPSEGQSTISGRAVSAIAFSIVGLVVLVDAIPRIARVLSHLAFQPTMEFEGRWTANVIAELIALGVQVILGAVLLVGGRALSQLVTKIRTAGLNDKDQNQA
ncbi:MAG: hypothetical protein KAV00_04990 [Phycisphaerae bacterium]|nr:hypothetical protein [Phycisphaerae bacterium]